LLSEKSFSTKMRFSVLNGIGNDDSADNPIEIDMSFPWSLPKRASD
jgi:hypothetical protein